VAATAYDHEDIAPHRHHVQLARLLSERHDMRDKQSSHTRGGQNQTSH
jgi:hypothetical protein